MALKNISIIGQVFVPDSTTAPTALSSCGAGLAVHDMCISLGGTWSGTSCTLPTAAAAPAPAPKNNAATSLSFTTSTSSVGITFDYNGPPNSQLTYTCDAADCSPVPTIFGSLDSVGALSIAGGDTCTAHSLTSPCTITYTYRAVSNGSAQTIALTFTN